MKLRPQAEISRAVRHAAGRRGKVEQTRVCTVGGVVVIGGDVPCEVVEVELNNLILVSRPRVVV